jgi:hypothetical protein
MAICIQRIFAMRSRTALTMSKSPMLTPPDVTMASQRAAASVSAASRASSSSRTSPRSIGTQPAWSRAPSSIVRLLSRIWPGASGAPSSISSSPVDSPPTRARATTGTETMPTLASTPSAAGRISVPAGNSRSPWWTSSPAWRTASPAATLRPIRTRWPPSSDSVSSTITTASAPGGNGAPVMMRTARPGSTGIDGGAPAAIVPATSSSTGTPATSAARTA